MIVSMNLPMPGKKAMLFLATDCAPGFVPIWSLVPNSLFKLIRNWIRCCFSVEVKNELNMFKKGHTAKKTNKQTKTKNTRRISAYCCHHHVWQCFLRTSYIIQFCLSFTSQSQFLFKFYSLKIKVRHCFSIEWLFRWILPKQEKKAMIFLTTDCTPGFALIWSLVPTSSFNLTGKVDQVLFLGRS